MWGSKLVKPRLKGGLCSVGTANDGLLAAESLVVRTVGFLGQIIQGAGIT